MARKTVVVSQNIESRILLVRGQKVMQDADLAELYGVPTKVLNQAVKRNARRFPQDFMFRLSTEEYAVLRSQIVTSNDTAGRGGRRHPPYVFTEHGAIMAASVINSPRAIETGVQVVRAFVRLRELISSHKALSRKFDELERKVSEHGEALTGLVHAIRQLMAPPAAKKKRSIGFAPWEKTQ